MSPKKRKRHLANASSTITHTQPSKSKPAKIAELDDSPIQGYRHTPPPEWFDIWLRPIYTPWYDELGRAIKVHCFEDKDWYKGYRYCLELDPNTLTREELKKRELFTLWPKAAWKPLIGPRSDIESPSILDETDIPESKPFPPVPLPGSVADQRIQAEKPEQRETTAAERIAEKARLAKERAERKKRYYGDF